MGPATPFVKKMRAALVLGRVSNLPTVVTNALAGAVLSGGVLEFAGVPALALALFYVGGMYLNDAFDADVDACERPARPIPAGIASRTVVFAAGFTLLALGISLGAASQLALAIGAALALCILLYDALHERIAAAPLVMGFCRVLSYLFAAAAIGGELNASRLWLGAVGLFLHIAGLTYAARQEAYDRIEALWPLLSLACAALLAFHLSQGAPLAVGAAVAFLGAQFFALRLLLRRKPGDVSRAVGLLIAAIALYDASVIGAGAPPLLCGLAALCFPLTLGLQKIVPGT
jgi:UbiA prenyltransferase family